MDMNTLDFTCHMMHLDCRQADISGPCSLTRPSPVDQYGNHDQFGHAAQPFLHRRQRTNLSQTTAHNTNPYWGTSTENQTISHGNKAAAQCPFAVAVLCTDASF